MADETNSVRITNAQVYAEVMELKAIQIEAVTELRGMKNLPERVSAIEQEIARLKVIAGLTYGVFAAVLAGVVTALLRLL
jgi:uncharacterized small protein (DUF1192 family)